MWSSSLSAFYAVARRWPQWQIGGRHDIWDRGGSLDDGDHDDRSDDDDLDDDDVDSDGGDDDDDLDDDVGDSRTDAIIADDSGDYVYCYSFMQSRKVFLEFIIIELKEKKYCDLQIFRFRFSGRTGGDWSFPERGNHPSEGTSE